MTRQNRCSLHDVARHLGLSAMTVSRVLNNSGPVNPETRLRVEAAVRELGFKKDRFASINARKRGAAGGQRSVVVDAIVEDEADQGSFGFFSQVQLAAIRRLETAGCHIVLSDLTRRPDERSQAVAEADAIVCCTPLSAEVHRRIGSLNPSIVRVTAFDAQHGASLVGPDDVGGGTLAAELAARGGHRRALVLTSPLASHAARAEAFARRLQSLSPTAEVATIAYPLRGDGVESDEAGIQGLLAARWPQGAAPSLCFGVGGWPTLMLYRFLRSRGLAIPGRVSLIGFDALAFYDHLDIPVTRIEFSVGAIGTRLAEEALRRLAAGTEDEPETILLPCRYVGGGSFVDVSAMDDARVQRHAP